MLALPESAFAVERPRAAYLVERGKAGSDRAGRSRLFLLRPFLAPL